MKSLAQNPEAAMSPAKEAMLRKAFDLCVKKIRVNIKRMADDPRAAPWSNDGDPFLHKEAFFDLGNWTTSFYTGMSLMAWRATGDSFFLDQVLRLAPLYREKATTQHLDMHHDAGFLYSLYSVALFKLLKDPAHRETGIAAAEALMERYNPKGGFIRAWGRLDTDEFNDMAIIDCLMNLPLLYWAARETGRKDFHDVAVRHADTTLACFVRPDDSVCHAYRFDLRTGAPLRPDNYCGFGVDSHWARGTTWAIYGFALSYRYTGDRKYLDIAVRLARKFVDLLDAEVVPVWDFRLPADAPPTRDASAAAVAVCAFQELARHGIREPVLADTKDALLEQLCSPQYLCEDDSLVCALRCSGRANNYCASWGDYYLMECLNNELGLGESFW